MIKIFGKQLWCWGCLNSGRNRRNGRWVWTGKFGSNGHFIFEYDSCAHCDKGKLREVKRMLSEAAQPEC